MNKVAGLAIARLVEAEQVDVRLKTTLKQVMQGEVESMAIDLQGFLAREHLRIETFRFQIGQVAVIPKLAMKGNIQLVQPALGNLTFTLRQEQLSHFLQSTVMHQPSQDWRVHDIQVAFLPENQIQIRLSWATAPGAANQSSTLLTRPDMTPDRQAVHLTVQSTTGNTVPTDLITAILTPIDEVLSLHDFKDRGTLFQIQQLGITADHLTLHAAATIEQFPQR